MQRGTGAREERERKKEKEKAISRTLGEHSGGRL